VAGVGGDSETVRGALGEGAPTVDGAATGGGVLLEGTAAVGDGAPKGSLRFSSGSSASSHCDAGSRICVAVRGSIVGSSFVGDEGTIGTASIGARGWLFSGDFPV
jgi:hypothetical protein